MGGLGTFMLCARPVPPLITATSGLVRVMGAVPVCGGGNPVYASAAVSNTSHWHFVHARSDVVIACGETEGLVAAMRRECEGMSRQGDASDATRPEHLRTGATSDGTSDATQTDYEGRAAMSDAG